MADRGDEQMSRRPYCKPQVEKVQLDTEQAVLLSCKSNGPKYAGPTGSNKCKTAATACITYSTT